MKQDDFSSVDIHTLAVDRQWQSQYRALMRWGELIQTKPELRIDQNRIRGCAASAWLALKNEEFYFDSDSRIINGLAALLLAQIKLGDIGVEDTRGWENLLQDLGLRKHLSPSRNNGVQALIRRMSELWSDAAKNGHYS
jgi:cysteine desulfuration protein SufE